MSQRREIMTIESVRKQPLSRLGFAYVVANMWSLLMLAPPPMSCWPCTNILRVDQSHQYLRRQCRACVPTIHFGTSEGYFRVIEFTKVD